MSEFRLNGSDVFGRYCRIEQLRFYAPNEMYLYKVVASLRSNCWCEVPYKTASKEVRHDSIEDCVLAICCGVDETEALRFRVADVEFVPKPICDRDALLEEVKELERCAWYFGLDFDEDEPMRDRLKEASEDFAGCARRIREALGVQDAEV